MKSILFFRKPLSAGTFLTSLLLAFVVLTFTSCMKDDGIEELIANQMKADNEKIEAYIAANNLSNVQKTPSGVYYIITQEGTGVKAKAGDVVSVHYTLFNLSDKQIETSIDNPKTGGEPISFTLGRGQVIRGWDEGIAQLNKGSKAILLIPSPLAYGNQYINQDLPANSVLRFDVELMDIVIK